MTITHQDELDGLKKIGRIVANTRHTMAAAMEPGITTRELDAMGRALLERQGAVPAPHATYGFPGATCISVNQEIAHGVAGDRRLAEGDLVNIDVSASLNGYFADTGATFRLGPVPPALDRLCRRAVCGRRRAPRMTGRSTARRKRRSCDTTCGGGDPPRCDHPDTAGLTPDWQVGGTEGDVEMCVRVPAFAESTRQCRAIGQGDTCRL